MSLSFEEIRLSPKLSVCRANQDNIRNQRIELRRNRLILGRKAGGGGGVNQLPQIYDNILSSFNC
jgi:hypothetical protein